jgi:hypothetical protein
LDMNPKYVTQYRFKSVASHIGITPIALSRIRNKLK